MNPIDRLGSRAVEVPAEATPEGSVAASLAGSEDVLYQIDIDISKERRVTLRVRPGDDIEELLDRVKRENELSQRTFEKLRQAVTESIETYMS